MYLTLGEDTVPNSDTSPPIPEPKVPFPRISNLSIEDQKYFLQTYKQYILGNEIDLGMIDHLQVKILDSIFYA